MQLKDVQQVLSQSSKTANSAAEALRQLNACSERALGHLGDGNTVQAQAFLEQGFTNLMAAFHYLNIDLERVVQREKRRQQAESAPSQEERVILVFSDHAELRVGGELRGSIPLYSEDDYRELRQIAHLFQCRLEHADHLQLNLFSLLRNPS